MGRRSTTAACLLLSLCGAGGCRDRFVSLGDGGADAAGADVPRGDGPEPLALDLAVTGCAQYDVASVVCAGAPPLTLSFAPVSSPSLVRFLWNFGDGTPMSSERAPSHTYVLPGMYDVTVIGAGDVGTLSRTRPALVSVAALPAGAPCDVDAQCATGLGCVCGTGAGCAAVFTRGLCTTACAATACGAGAACASVALPPAVDNRRPLCLAACQTDGDCPPGLGCRDLPGNGTGGQPRWVRGCFPPALAEVGRPCRDASGLLQDAACATGLCADLGAVGVCSATCGAGAPCPPGSACATFGDGRALCLRACAGATDCTRDPQLSCVSPGAAGPLGFKISGGSAGPSTLYCGPH